MPVIRRTLPPGLVNQLGQRPTGREILVRDTAISTSMGGRFTEFLASRTLSNGEETTLPVLTPDEVRKLSTPYSQWAPPPFNNTDNPHEAALISFVFTFSGMEDLFNFEALLSGGFQSGMDFVDHEVHFGKSRVWDGFAPISDRRWKEKGLDRLENLEKAMQHAFLAMGSFEYFCVPVKQRKMRELYNKAYDHLAHFDTVLEAHYQSTNTAPAREGGRARPAKAAHLWTEFFFTHVVFVTERMHAWVSKMVKPLIDEVLEKVRHSSPLPGSGGRAYSPEQMTLLDQLHLLNEAWSRADMRIFVSLQGFKNELPQWRHLANTPVTDWTNYTGSTSLSGLYPADPTVRANAFGKRMKWLCRFAIVGELMEHNTAIQSGRINPCEAEAVHKLCTNQVKSYAEARDELRGAQRMPVNHEVWVTYLKHQLGPLPPLENGREPRPPRYNKWGYVAYRIHYDHSAEEWTAFTEAFKNDVTRWGEGVAGAQEIKSKARIKWIDGQEVGIAEGDIAAARRHFHALRQPEGGLDPEFKTVDAFLVAGKASINSYLNLTRQQKPLLPGQNLIEDRDLGPWIAVAEALDHEGKQMRHDELESPGWSGCVRVLGAVIFDDVWANLLIRANPLNSYWPMAALNPEYVYGGPMAPYQKESWTKFENLRKDLFKKADEWKKAGRLGPASST